jgi:hypothetical protein
LRNEIWSVGRTLPDIRRFLAPMWLTIQIMHTCHHWF